jgi:hypothetical protein
MGGGMGIPESQAAPVSPFDVVEVGLTKRECTLILMGLSRV